MIWTPRTVIPARDNPTPSEQVARMRDIDGLRKSIRDLVNEYGAEIVGNMLDDADGPWDSAFVKQLAFDLKVWRWRRQEQWLATDYIDKKVSDSFARGLQNWTR